NGNPLILLGLEAFTSGVQLQFNPKIPTFAPTRVAFERLVLIRHERESEESVFTDGPVPTLMRIEHGLGATAGAPERFVGDADDVVIEVVGGVAKVPFSHTVLVIRAVICGRNWFVRIAQPETRIPFVAGFN